ncbi:MAG: DUF1572 family protein [Spirochaetaceae bacterium]|nr:DUF1572 family protein [Spirochaetaceae bacterium]
MNQVARAYVASSLHQLDHARRNINHCFDQLGAEDLWWTPRAGSNSIGVIIQHLIGNLRQWAISGIGGEPDVRDRPAEFRVEARADKTSLQARFNRVLDRVAAVYAEVDDAAILDGRRIQGSDTTVLAAIYDTMSHLKLHTGQVLYLTRLRLGEAYRESWTPTTREQGA